MLARDSAKQAFKPSFIVVPHQVQVYLRNDKFRRGKMADLPLSVANLTGRFRTTCGVIELCMIFSPGLVYVGQSAGDAEKKYG